MMLQYYEIYQSKHLDTKKKVLINTNPWLSFKKGRNLSHPQGVNLLAIVFSSVT